MRLYHLYNFLTAPGVVVHELAHAFFCVISGVKIYRVRLYQFGPVAGFVEHEEPRGFWSGLFITLGPLIINSLLAAFLFSLFRPPFWSWHSWVFLLLGLAVGLHAIPSGGDARSLFQLANRRVWRNPLMLLAYPLVLVLGILYWLKRFHIHFVYTAALFWLGNIFWKF